MLGIDLGGTKIAATLLSADGQVLWQHRVPTPATDYAATLQAIAELVDAARMRGGSPFSVGIGTPGTARDDGLMKNCNSTCLNGQPLQRDIETLLGHPIGMANDANCLALSEATDGAGAGASVVFAAILGTGAGAGIAINGQVLRGANGLAGEWGHNTLPFANFGRGKNDDPHFACYCGQRACIETFVSGSGLAADHQHVTGQSLTGEMIVQRAQAGDAACEAMGVAVQGGDAPPRPSPRTRLGQHHQPAGPRRHRARRWLVAPGAFVRTSAGAVGPVGAGQQRG
jgi:fructokinase